MYLKQLGENIQKCYQITAIIIWFFNEMSELLKLAY